MYESMGKSADATRAGEWATVTDNYEITLVHGIDRDQMEKLVFASGSKAAPYTGEPLTCDQYVLAEGVLDPAHEAVPHFTGSQTEIGFSDNTFTVTVVDTVTGEDVTYRYDISYEYGTLEVYDQAPSTGGEISDDGSLDNSTQNADAIAARVWAENSGRVYLRWKSYGNYSFREDTGNWGWGDAMAYPLASENMLYTAGQALAMGGALPTYYQIEILGKQFLLPNYVAEGPRGAYNDVVLSPYADSYALYGYNWQYSYADALRYAAQGIESEQNKLYTAFVYEQYLSVPESTKQALLAFAEQHGLAADRLSTLPIFRVFFPVIHQTAVITGFVFFQLALYKTAFHNRTKSSFSRNQRIVKLQTYIQDFPFCQFKEVAVSEKYLSLFNFLCAKLFFGTCIFITHTNFLLLLIKNKSFLTVQVKATGICRFRFAEPRQGVVMPSTFTFFPTTVCGHHSREPTLIRGFREPLPKVKTWRTQTDMPYFWLRQRDLNPRPLGP